MSAGLMPLHVLNVGRFGLTIPMYAQNNLGGKTWPTANRALYWPVHIPSPFLAARAFHCQAGNNTGNVDIGIYDINGNRLVSTGSTARGSTNVAQYIDITDTWLSPGDYYWAMVGSSTSGQTNGVSASAPLLRADGCLKEDLGATTLPSSMNPATFADADVIFMGFTQSATL